MRPKTHPGVFCQIWSNRPNLTKLDSFLSTAASSDSLPIENGRQDAPQGASWLKDCGIAVQCFVQNFFEQRLQQQSTHFTQTLNRSFSRFGSSTVSIWSEIGAIPDRHAIPGLCTGRWWVVDNGRLGCTIDTGSRVVKSGEDIFGTTVTKKWPKVSNPVDTATHPCFRVYCGPVSRPRPASIPLCGVGRESLDIRAI